MQINDRRGVITVKLTKAEVRHLLEASYIQKRLGKVVDGEQGEAIAATAESTVRIAKTFGGQHVDGDGNLILTDAEKARLGIE